MPVIFLLLGMLVTALGISFWVWDVLKKWPQAQDEASAVPIADLRTMRDIKDADQQQAALQDQLFCMKSDLDAAKERLLAQERIDTEIITDLRSRNEELKQKIVGLRSAERQVFEEESQVEHLRAENSAFRVQLSEADADMRELKERLSTLEEENARFKSSSGEVMGALDLIERARHQYQKQLQGFYHEIERLSQENLRFKEQAEAGAEVEGLLQTKDELSGRLKEIEMVRAAQAEKNEYLQYELTKSRAHIIALERLSERTLSTKPRWNDVKSDGAVVLGR